jgi:hypothetical protein
MNNDGSVLCVRLVRARKRVLPCLIILRSTLRIRAKRAVLTIRIEVCSMINSGTGEHPMITDLAGQSILSNILHHPSRSNYTASFPTACP